MGDLDSHKAQVPNMNFHDMFHDMFVHDMFVSLVRTQTVCFTICLFISPDLDGICFTICLFISPDLDGHRAPQLRH